MTSPDEQPTQQLGTVTPAKRRRSWPVRILLWIGVTLGVLFVIGIIGSIIAPVPRPAPAAETPVAAPPTTEALAPPAPAPAAEPASPAEPAPVAGPDWSDLDEDDMTPVQRAEYLTALIDEVPAAQTRVRGSDVESFTQAAGYVARDGIRICGAIASGETDEVVARTAALRMEVPESDGPAVRAVTERYVCDVLS